MPHRDDHEAARHRIAALEQQLAETEERAQREVAEANARAERAERDSETRLGPKRRERVAATREEPESVPEHVQAGWPTARRRRFLRATAIATVVLDLPVVILLAGWRRDLDDADAWLFPWLFLPVLVLFPLVYLFARWTRAPYPGSVVPVQMIAAGIGYMAVLFGASDMVWNDMLATTPLREISRGFSGLVGIAFHATVLSFWCAEAALSEMTGSD
jgi:hypothetical protein